MAARLEETLAGRLREVAREKKLPLSHVADRAAVARSYFWRLLDGSNSATLAVVQRIAEALGIDPLELLAPRTASSQGTKAATVKTARTARTAREKVTPTKKSSAAARTAAPRRKA